MNLITRVTGSLKQTEGGIRKHWGERMTKDWKHLASRRDTLVKTLQQRYGPVRADANRTVDEWRRKLKL